MVIFWVRTMKLRMIRHFFHETMIRGLSEIIDTPLALAFWTLGETRNSAHSKVKKGE